MIKDEDYAPSDDDDGIVGGGLPQQRQQQQQQPTADIVSVLRGNPVEDKGGGEVNDEMAGDSAPIAAVEAGDDDDDDDDDEDEDETNAADTSPNGSRTRKAAWGTRKRETSAPLKQAYSELKDAQRERDRANEEYEEARVGFEAARERLEAASRRKDKVNARVLSAAEATKKVELDQPLRWNSMYKKLAQYVVEHGHCFPPSTARGEDPEMDAMFKWVSQQRRGKGRMEKNRPDRVEALDKLGFVWDAKKELLRRKLNDMQVYIAEHGNLSIPFKYPPNQQLATWVHEQKKEYKKFQRGLPSTMSEERIETLERAGFQWTCETSRKRRRAADTMTEEELWMEGYNKLLAFHQKYGHCRVNLKDGSNKRQSDTLREWAAWQRRQHDLFKEGKPSQLTPDRVEKLENLGFVWEKSWSAYCSKNNMNFKGQKRKLKMGEEEEGNPDEVQHINRQAV